MKTLLIFNIIFLLVSPLSCLGDTARKIKWEDLVPANYRVDPLGHLPGEIREQVEWMIYLYQNLPAEKNPEEQKFHDEMTKALPELKKQGIDIERIVAERQVRETSINTELDSSYIQIPGYLLPLDLSGKAIREFLLVPYAGACIHVPPPPPNQIIHAVSDEPIEFDVNEVYKPILATGHLKAKSLSKELFLGDGSDDIDIGYTMRVEKVEAYKDQIDL